MSMAKGAPGLDLAGAGSCLRTSRTNSILFRPPFIRSPLTLISSFIFSCSLTFTLTFHMYPPTPFYSDSIFIRPSQFLLSGSDSEMRQGELLSNLFNTKSTAIRAGIFALSGFEGFTQWKCELSLELKSKPTLCCLT